MILLLRLSTRECHEIYRILDGEYRQELRIHRLNAGKEGGKGMGFGLGYCPPATQVAEGDSGLNVFG